MLTGTLGCGRDAGGWAAEMGGGPRPILVRVSWSTSTDWAGAICAARSTWRGFCQPCGPTQGVGGRGSTPRGPPALHQAVCTHARKRIRNHLRQGCRSALPGGGQPSRTSTPRDRHPPRASPQRVRPVLGACRGGMRESRQAAVVPCQSFGLIHPSPHPNPRGPFR